MQNATWQILRIQNSCEDGCSRDSWCLFGSPMKIEQFLDKMGEMETELELIFIPTNFRYFNYLPWSVSPEDPSASYEFCAKPYTGNHGSEREGISEAGATCATRVLPLEMRIYSKSDVNSFLLGLVSGSRESREKGGWLHSEFLYIVFFSPLKKARQK